jgi:diguanylate cyclase (GGDEF)-like protein/PAS domain S-box-containing protein
VEELGQRLAEAEAIIQALLSGQVDAVIDSTGGSAPLLLAKAQEALRESEERHRRIVETTHEGVWAIGADQKTTFMNRRMAQMLGCEADMGAGSTPFDFLDEAGGVALRLRIREQKAKQVEIRYIRRDGTSLWALVGSSPLFDSTGRHDGMLAMVMDITDRKEAVVALDGLSRRAQLREHILTTMLSSISDFAYIFDRDGRFLFVNQPLLDLWGIPLEAAVGKNFFGLGYEEDLAGVLQGNVRKVFETKKEFTGETAYTSPTGVPGYYEYIFSPAFGADGTVEFVAGCTRNITERKLAEQVLQTSEEKFRQLAENIHEVFWMMNAAATEMIYVSPAYEDIWGGTTEGLFANPGSWMNSIHPEDRASAGETFRRQIRGEILESEYRIVRPLGDIRWIRNCAFPVHNSDGNIVRVAGVAEDITERKRAEIRLVHQALYDELTGLPNRRLFQEKLRQAIAESGARKSGAVFFIDIDQFKLVNDTLGHSAGDLLLKQVVDRLLAVSGESGTLARFGGDEFTFVAAGFEDRDSVGRFGDRLIACLDEPFKVAGRELFIGASIGVSLFPENGTDPDALKRDADMAMHEAKRAGKNQLRFFTPEFSDAASERLEMESRLRRALALSEFKLQYQPQFASGRSRPSRFEALIRWYTPDAQPVAPLKFIPVAEQNGLIVPIGAWVLREACRQCAAWQTGGLKGAGVAVNVSALQFVRPDFVDLVIGTLESTGLPPHLLELEVTESVFIQDVKESALKMTKLRSLGVTIALDDFGTGYSSFSYLQNLPIDTLKIDRSFLTENEGRPRGVAVLRCFVELAHALGLRVVGEGVETITQLDLLCSLGCDEFQGFLLGRPSFEVSMYSPNMVFEKASSRSVTGHGSKHVVNADAPCNVPPPLFG